MTVAADPKPASETRGVADTALHLTPRQRKIIQAIEDLSQRCGYAPSMREIVAVAGWFEPVERFLSALAPRQEGLPEPRPAAPAHGRCPVVS